MSGIAGIFTLENTSVSREHLRLMASKLVKRGPDGISYYCKKSVGFVHCMLYDTPESLFEKLPNSILNDTFVLTFHGRLDNRQELYNKIGWIKPLAEISDSDFILSAYQKWRKTCVDHFLGDFAFALWDKLENTIFCARDHMGIKPFYYYASHKYFAFASEIKALLALPEVPCVMNNERVADFFTCAVADNRSTFYDGIVRLPPGHILEVTREKLLVTRYHEFSPMKLDCKNDSEYEEQFREIFVNAVQVRLRSAFPVGSYLSGGLDSSSIVCTVAGLCDKTFPGRLQTFSGIFDDVSSCDERDFFSTVIKRYNLDSHTLLVDKVNPAIAYERLMLDEDEPFIAPHVFMIFTLLLLIQKEGVRVQLDGHDGDAAVSYGYSLFAELAISLNLVKLIDLYKESGVSSPKTVTRKIIGLYWSIFCNKLPVYLPFSPKKLKIERDISKLAVGFVKKTGIRARLIKGVGELPFLGQKEEVYHSRNITQPLHSITLELLERISVNVGVVSRYPYFDKRVIEFCLALPVRQKFQNGLNRNIVRRTLKDIIPNNIAERRKKTDFTPSFIRAFQENDRGWLLEHIDVMEEANYNVLSKCHCERDLRIYKNVNSTIRLILLRDLLAGVVFYRWKKNRF